MTSPEIVAAFLLFHDHSAGSLLFCTSTWVEDTWSFDLVLIFLQLILQSDPPSLVARPNFAGEWGKNAYKRPASYPFTLKIKVWISLLAPPRLKTCFQITILESSHKTKWAPNSLACMLLWSSTTMELISPWVKIAAFMKLKDCEFLEHSNAEINVFFVCGLLAGR